MKSTWPDKTQLRRSFFHVVSLLSYWVRPIFATLILCILGDLFGVLEIEEANCGVTSITKAKYKATTVVTCELVWILSM